MTEFVIKKDSSTKWYLLLLLIIELMVLFVSGVYSVWLAPIFLILLLGIFGSLIIKNSQFNYFLLFFTVIPFFPLLPQIVNSILSLLGIIVISFIWLYNIIKKQVHYEPLPDYIKYFIILFLGICTLTTLFSFNLTVSILELTRIYLILFFIIVVFNCVTTIKNIHYLLNASIIVAILVSIISLPEIFTFTPADIVSGDLIKMRLTSFYINANSMSIPFVFVIPIIFAKIFYKESKTKFISKLIYFFIFLFFLYIVLLTNSRSSLLYILAALFVLLLKLRSGRYIIAGTISLFIAALPFIGETVFLLLRLERGFTGRDYLWKAAIEMIKDYPWFGVGLGNYELVKYKYIIPVDYFSNFTRVSALSGAAHNLVLTVAAESGVIAGVIMLGFLIKVLVKCNTLIRSTQNNEYKNLLFILTAIIFGFTIRSIFESGIIIGSGRIDDFIYFLVPLVSLARIEKIIKMEHA